MNRRGFALSPNLTLIRKANCSDPSGPHFLRRLSACLGIALVAALSAPTSGLAQERNPDRNAYFGEQHVHTSWSVDAWLFGNHLTGPDAALKYAQGETIKHPLGYNIKIEQPLDWMGVTDHSEYVGITKQANTPGSAVSKMPQAQPLILKNPNDPEDVQKVFNYLVSLVSKPPIKAFMSSQVAGTIWKENVKIADENNKPGKFTAFCAYEYTSQHNFRNLHRNVYFRDCAKVSAQPFSAFELLASGGSLEVDGCTAQGGPRTARHLA